MKGYMSSVYTVHFSACLSLQVWLLTLQLIGMVSACILIRDRRNRDFVYRDLGSDDGLHV